MLLGACGSIRLRRRGADAGNAPERRLAAEDIVHHLSITPRGAIFALELTIQGSSCAGPHRARR